MARRSLCLGAVFGVLLAAPGLRAQPRTPSVPAGVWLERAPGGADVAVVLRPARADAQPVSLGRVTVAEGSAVRGMLLRDDPTTVLVVGAERTSHRGESYLSALWRVDAAGSTRLVGGLTDASRALVTERGSVLVQRGADGAEPPLDPTRRTLRERVDRLTLDRVDPRSGAVRTVWSGEGQLAYLAAPLRGDEALVYLVSPRGASLFALDASTGATRVLVGSMAPLARDFTYDPSRDEVIFARAEAPGSDGYEVVALAAHGTGAPRVLVRGFNDHLMPRALRDGAVAFSLPGDQGLAVRAGDGSTVRAAPWGAGSDCALGATPDGRYVAVRHSTAQSEQNGVFDRVTRVVVGAAPASVEAEFVGLLSRAP